MTEVDAALDALAAVAGRRVAGRAARPAGRPASGGPPPRSSGSSAALLLGDLRQGALEGVMVDAVAPRRRAAGGGGAPGADAAREPARRGRGRAGRRRGRARGDPASRSARPIAPMLAGTAAGRRRRAGARPARRPSSGSSTAPGSRCTAPATTSAVFTRSLDDITARVPEVVEAALALPARAAVLDGEAIALGPGRPPPAVPGHRGPRGRAPRRRAAAPARCR